MGTTLHQKQQLNVGLLTLNGHCVLHYWCRRDTNNAERSGRPNEAVSPDNFKKIHKIVWNDRKVKLRELADILKISKERVAFLLHEHLSIRKLFSKFVHY